MKKVLAVLFVIITVLSFAACGKKAAEAPVVNQKPTQAPITHPEGFEPQVADKSEIIGTWTETEVVDGICYDWTFYEDADMHRTKVFVAEDVRRSAVGYYNYNEETGEMSYWLISEGETATTSYKVKIDGKNMTLTPAAGGEAITLVKQ